MKTIFYGGRVYRGQLPNVEAFAVEDGPYRPCRHKKSSSW